MRKGIDVSAWQHVNGQTIDYAAVAAAGFEWAAVEVNLGNGGLASTATADARGFRDVGLDVVLYHFAYPTQFNASECAAIFRAYCEQIDPSMPRCLDIERGYELGWVTLAQWCERFDVEAGVNVDYYNQNYRANLHAAGYLHASREWVAIPGAVDNEGLYAVQYSTEHVPGIGPATDVNHVRDKGDDDMTLDDLAEGLAGNRNVTVTENGQPQVRNFRDVFTHFLAYAVTGQDNLTLKAAQDAIVAAVNAHPGGGPTPTLHVTLEGTATPQ